MRPHTLTRIGTILELRQLRAFVAIADHGHYGRAADSVGLTQPAITQRIKALERELGTPLLTRSARGVNLTSAGQALIEHARRLLLIEDRAVRALHDHAKGVVGRLRISYLTLWDFGPPANIVAEFRRRYPAVVLEMSTGYSQANMDRLVAGNVDFAFVGVSIGERRGIAIRTLDRHEMVVVMTPQHPLALIDRVPIERLRGEPLISVPPGVNNSLVAASLSWLGRHTGESPTVVREEPPDQIAAALMRTGNAIALMTVHRAEIAQKDGLIYRSLVPSPMIEYGAAYFRDDPSPALANLLEVVDEVAPALPDALPEGNELIWARPGSATGVAG
ncbi:MAG: LysR family transcriptional regulator [Chloroflexi bacterium]|nr:MAG: LysR family transcriptional regulator [Chloroflexota bacterium]